MGGGRIGMTDGPPGSTSASRASAGGGPLSAEHFAEIRRAKARSKKVRRCAGVAAFSGATMAFFAVTTLMIGLFGDWLSLVCGVALGVIAYNEIRGAAGLKRFDPGAARLLAINQIGLGVLICGYSALSLVMAIRNPAIKSAMAQVGGSTGDPNMDATLASVAGLADMAVYGLYGTLFVVGIIAPGLTALYYHSRGRLVKEFVASTPAWVIDAMRATG